MPLFPELDNLVLAGLIESFTGDLRDGIEYARAYFAEVASGLAAEWEMVRLEH